MVLHHVCDFQIFHDNRFGQCVYDVSGDFVDIVGSQVFQLLMDTGDDPLLLLVVSAFLQRPFIDRLLMRLSIFSDDIFIVVNVGLFFAGQASLFPEQPSFQFPDLLALIDVFIEGAI